MSEHLNTFSACDLHKNGHSEHCLGCEVDALRSLLREVASSDCFDVAREVLGVDGGKYMNVFMTKELWEKILPLRTPPIVKVDPNG